MAQPPSNYNVSFIDPTGFEGQPEATGSGDGIYATSVADARRQALALVAAEARRVGAPMWGGLYDESSDQGDFIETIKP